MSVSVEADVSSPLCDGRSAVLDQTLSKSSSESHSFQNGEGSGQDNSELGTPKQQSMAFTIDFGQGKVDNRRLEELAKKSQARHQRVQSMSTSLTSPSPAPQKPPMSAKLPRKAQGYNSEGYFSSDQEDSGLSNSVKLRTSPLAQSLERTHITSPIVSRHLKSPLNDNFQPKRTSKSPIVDSIMSRSDNYTTHQGLVLPLRNSFYSNVPRSPSYGNLSSSYQPKYPMADIMDQSPEGLMLTDISSPELDVLTPDNGLSTPEPRSPLFKGRASSETPDLFKKCIPKVEQLYIEDDIQSNHSSTGTYTIEDDTYTEEQKARMSIDRTPGEASQRFESKRPERDPELIFDFPQRVTTRREHLQIPLSPKALDSQVSKDKNVLEISCCYESPTENDLAAQTSKQIKSTRNYLEKIKNRVRTITDKTFAKSAPEHVDEVDRGMFTSVTASGVLNSNKVSKVERPTYRRRCNLSKSEIDQTDYVHRLSRESSVPVSLNITKLPFEEAKFESNTLQNVQRSLRERSSPEEVVNHLSHLSINRCKGDKTWIQDWADSVKKYNYDSLGAKDSDLTSYITNGRPPQSPQHHPVQSQSPRGTTPTKIPSPVGILLNRRTPDLIPTQDTESYLLKTQNAITNLQAKLHSNRTNNFSYIPPQLTSSLISEKTIVSRLPVSQLSRSNSLNYRLRRKEPESSPLRSPEHYVITGTDKIPESTKKLLNSASRSLDTDQRKDANMNSSNSDRGFLSSSDDKTISNRPQYDVDAILSPYRKTHARNKSFDACYDNLNQGISLKNVLKNNAENFDQTCCLGDMKTHQRVFSDGTSQFRPTSNVNNIAFGTMIRRSSSFNTVNKNNNYIDPRTIRRNVERVERDDYLSDDSDHYDKSQDNFKRQVYRGRIDSPDLKSIAPANSPKCPNTPEMYRKFGPGLVRNSVRVTSKERGLNRMSEPPISKESSAKPSNHQSRKISEPTRQAVLNRLTKSRSTTREIQPKGPEKGTKKPAQHRSSSALPSKEVEFSNWKKRSSYDPMKAAQEGKKRQMMAKRQECNKDDLSSPSHSSPVHRSQSFHTTNIADLDLDTLEYSSEDEHLSTLAPDPMVLSTHSDTFAMRRNPDMLRKRAITNDVYFQVPQLTEKQKRRLEADKRKTFIIDDITPTRDNVDFLPKREDPHTDKRRTFILDSDTNSTTNGSSPRNSSIFSHEKNSLTTCTSDTEGESGAESAPVVLRNAGKRGTNSKNRHSGDFSMSSSTTSIAQKKPKEIQPRYLDISKYKNESSPKNFLRKDPSKTYVGVLNHSDRASSVSKGSAQQLEMEQKKQELEKWKRRATYDPRKAAAQGKPKCTPTKQTSSVLRSQSFHGPLVSPGVRPYRPPSLIVETYDANSDNDF